MNKITCNAEIFKKVQLKHDEITFINTISTLVNEPIQYNNDAIKNKFQPIQSNPKTAGIGWNKIANQLHFYCIASTQIKHLGVQIL